MRLFTEEFMDEADEVLLRLLNCGYDTDDSLVAGLLTVLCAGGRGERAVELTDWFNS